MSAQKVQGNTLLECALAVALFSCLMASVIAICVTLNDRRQTASELMREIHYMNFSMSYMGGRIRIAGLQDCVSRNDAMKYPAIEGYAANTTPRGVGVKARPDTSVVVLSECLSYRGKQRYKKIAFFIGKTARKNKSRKPVYALYEKIIGSRRLELTEGVDDFQVEYGVLNGLGDSGLHYVKADGVVDWNNVRGVFFKLHRQRVWSAYVALREFGAIY